MKSEPLALNNSNDAVSHLPIELIFRIIEFSSSDTRAICKLSAVSRAWRSTIRNSNPWKRMCEQRRYIIASSSPYAPLQSPPWSLSQDNLVDQMSELQAVTPTNPRDTRPHLVAEREIDSRIMPLQSLPTLSLSSTSADSWKSFFVNRWTHENNRSRGNCIVRGVNVQYGSMSCMQLCNGSVVAGFQDAISVWDIISGDQKLRLTGHNGVILCVQAHDGYVASSGNDKTIRVWNMKNGTLKFCFDCESVVKIIRFNNVEMICGDENGNVFIYCLVRGIMLLQIPLSFHHEAILHLQFDDSFICSASVDSVFQVFNRQTHRMDIVAGGMDSVITCISMASNTVVCGSRSGGLNAWSLPGKLGPLNTNSEQDMSRDYRIQIRGPRVHQDRLTCVQTIHVISQTAHPWIFAASNDGKCSVWSFVESNRYELITVLDFTIPILCIEIIPRIHLNLVIVSAACLDGKLHHWHLDGISPSLGTLSNEAPLKETFIGTQMTFSSSFLPITLHQEFMQVLMDRPPALNQPETANGIVEGSQLPTD